MEEDFSVAVSSERRAVGDVIRYLLYVKDQPKSIKPFKSFKSLKS